MPFRHALFPDELREWELQQSAAERGRRLTALKKATEGKELVEVEPGEWRYETVHNGAALP